jgi:hypothetical protein
MTQTIYSSPFTVLDIPHSSTTIPADLRKDIVLSDKALMKELLAMADRYTDDLFELPRGQAARVDLHGQPTRYRSRTIR